ncbi:hypothetical protein Tco_0909405 [Tanacetum coccineum]|uniref:Uncharacterized protein n=1 Tax=Tanacetum coccineum TaxID=301880 RepID=A0ABQ5CPV8_9ASTR
MASLKYCDKHNQVGFLKKPEESAGFAEIVDFLKGSHIDCNWPSTLTDGTLELRATIDTLEYTITETSVRSKLQLADASGIFMLPNTEIFGGIGNMRLVLVVVPISSDRGEREGKAQMIVEETQAPKRTKEQIQQEEASLAEAIRLQNLEEEETAKQVHLDALLAKRLTEEEELTEQQKQRKAQVQFEAQHYTEEDWIYYS